MKSPWIADWVSEMSGPFSHGGPTVSTLELARRTAPPLATKRYATAVDFERFLHRDFRPALKSLTITGGVPRPRVRPRAGAAAADEILGFALLALAVVEKVHEWEQGRAEVLGLSVEQMRRMKDDAWAASVLYETLTDGEPKLQLQLEKVRQKRRVGTRTKTARKKKGDDGPRIRVHGYSRR